MPKTMKNNIKTQRCLNATAVGTTTLNGSTVDMTGFKSVRFIVAYGAITDGTPNLQVQSGAQSDMSDAADLAGTDVAVADADDNDLAIVEVHNIRERYVRCNIVRGGATGSVIDGMIAEQFNPTYLPITEHADVAAYESHVTPEEGTP